MSRQDSKRVLSTIRCNTKAVTMNISEMVDDVYGDFSTQYGSSSPFPLQLLSSATSVNTSTLPALADASFIDIDEAITSNSASSSRPTPSADIPPSSTQHEKTTQLAWSKDMHRVLLETLIAQCRLGKRADSGFKKEAWTAVLHAVSEVYNGTLTITEKQVKSKVEWYKKMWKEWLVLEGNSGFGWDEPSQLFTAAEDVWRKFLKVCLRAYPV